MFGINKELKEKYNLDVKQEGHKLSVNAASNDVNNDDINCVIEVGGILLVAKLLYNSKYTSVFQLRLGGTVIFSATIQDR